MRTTAEGQDLNDGLCRRTLPRDQALPAGSSQKRKRAVGDLLHQAFPLKALGALPRLTASQLRVEFLFEHRFDLVEWVVREIFGKVADNTVFHFLVQLLAQLTQGCGGGDQNDTVKRTFVGKSIKLVRQIIGKAVLGQ